jgi:energy-coupling factor transport system substrate-specific component
VILATLPFAYGLLLGAHVLPGIIAQEVLRLPLVAVLSHVMAAIVASAFNPAWAGRFIGTALLFGGIQEGVAALTRYRAWGRGDSSSPPSSSARSSPSSSSSPPT